MKTAAGSWYRLEVGGLSSFVPSAARAKKPSAIAPVSATSPSLRPISASIGTGAGISTGRSRCAIDTSAHRLS